MSQLRLYVCARCHKAQHRIIPEDGDERCLRCGANTLEERPS